MGLGDRSCNRQSLVANGAQVVINGRSEDKGQQALKEMDAGDNVHFMAGDVMKGGRGRG